MNARPNLRRIAASILCLVTAAVAGASSAAGAHVLESQGLRLEIDDNGRLVSLKNRIADQGKGVEYLRSAGQLWRIYLQEDDELDIEVAPNDNAKSPRISKIATPAGPALRMVWPSLTRIRKNGLDIRPEPLPISVEVTATLPDDAAASDEIRWTISITNSTAPDAKIAVRECHFPLVGDLNLDPAQKLLWSKQGGELHANPRKKVAGQFTGYKASDHLFRVLHLSYPSFHSASANCFAFVGDQQGLYFGCHSTRFETTLHQFRMYPVEKVAGTSMGVFDKPSARLEAGFVRFPGIVAGATWTEGEFVTAPYSGDWHVVAKKYRRWADAWFRKNPDGTSVAAAKTVPEWIRRMNGWQRIILRHQHGEIHYRYADIPQIYADGAAAGINTFFMFGWQKGGHDNHYPDYTPNPKLGTEREMLDGIDHFNKNGGHVILYTNGRLIDRVSDYYKAHGAGPLILDPFGNEVLDRYTFTGPGNFAKLFVGRYFALACPSSSIWFDHLRAQADLAAAYGCHSLFLDQMGMEEPPCSNPAHNHPPHWVGSIAAKADIIRRLRDHLRTLNPNLGLGVEIISDVGGQHADYIHSLFTGSIGPHGFLEFFRYTFPEIILSDREIRDDSNIEPRVNRAVLLGIRSDVEIYRCRRTIAETPHYQGYLAKINALRQRQADILLEGLYTDTDGFTNSNPEVQARSFKRGTDNPVASNKDFAVVVTQSASASAKTTITVPAGLRFASHDGVGSPEVTRTSATEVRVSLPQHALAVLLFESAK